MFQSITDIVSEVRAELDRACAMYPVFRSYEEGAAVIEEELDELWDEIKKKQGKRSVARLRAEAVQVAAMSWRFCIDIGNTDLRPEDFPHNIWVDKFVSPAAARTFMAREFSRLQNDPLSAASIDLLILAIRFIRDCCTEEGAQR